jgi:hypothetical protein
VFITNGPYWATGSPMDGLGARAARRHHLSDEVDRRIGGHHRAVDPSSA